MPSNCQSVRLVFHTKHFLETSYKERIFLQEQISLEGYGGRTWLDLAHPSRDSNKTTYPPLFPNFLYPLRNSFTRKCSLQQGAESPGLGARQSPPPGNTTRSVPLGSHTVWIWPPNSHKDKMPSVQHGTDPLCPASDETPPPDSHCPFSWTAVIVIHFYTGFR